MLNDKKVWKFSWSI